MFVRSQCIAVVLVACGAAYSNSDDGIATAKAESPVVVRDHAGAKAQLGKLVAVKGIARDAKISAAVVADNLVVYCLGLASWPRGTSGRPVLAHGRLEQTDEFTATRGPGGEFRAGTDGAVWVLRDCRYEAR